MGKNSKAIEDERPAPTWDPRVEPGSWNDHDGQWDVPVGSDLAQAYRRERPPHYKLPKEKKTKKSKQAGARVRSAA